MVITELVINSKKCLKKINKLYEHNDLVIKGKKIDNNMRI